MCSLESKYASMKFCTISRDGLIFLLCPTNVIDGPDQIKRIKFTHKKIILLEMGAEEAKNSQWKQWTQLR